MKFEKLKIDGVVLITPDVYEDERGLFMESYNKFIFVDNNIDVDFVQDNFSVSKKNTLRGLHYQLPPFAQDKLVSVTDGAVLDIVVDLRKNSKTFGQYISAELNNENKQILFVPKGCAHGFLALSDNVYFHYKVSNKYSPEHDRGIIWNDPDLNIDWKLDGAEPMLSAKDAKLPTWQEIKTNL